MPLQWMSNLPKTKKVVYAPADEEMLCAPRMPFILGTGRAQKSRQHFGMARERGFCFPDSSQA